MANTIDPNLFLSNVKQQPRTGNSALGKDEFLKILMTQLQNQDPMNPMEDKDFIAQMATFSSLEQMTNMATSFDKFIGMQQQAQLISYNSFIGKDVTWHKVTESEDPNVKPVVTEGTGTVTSVRFKGDSVEFVLSDGTLLEPANISQVNSPFGGGNSLVEANHLVGRQVSWMEGDAEESSTVQSVSMKDGAVSLLMQNGDKVSASDLTKIQ